LERKAKSGIMVILLLISMLTLALGIQPVGLVGLEPEIYPSEPRRSPQEIETGSDRPETCECRRSTNPGILGYSSLSSDGAPGYCPSNGGSTEFEFIYDVTYEQKPSAIMIVTVFIWIANPTGCVVGEPCPEYDASPEYVNAWIDWDGNKVWEEEERVMDAALTGYQAINYRGWMTVSALVTTPPTANETTWMRVNLGWGHDPNEPCELTWDWGNVFDKEVTVKLPKIKKVTVTGIPDAKNPMINDPSVPGDEKVKLEAEIDQVEGFEVYKISWWGDVTPPSQGSLATHNPYEYTAAPGTHGGKVVGCTIFYKNTVTGEIGADVETKYFKLFFNKTANDDGDSEPNWFEYWKRDGPVPNMAGVKYDATATSYGYCTAAGEVYLTPYSAGQHYGAAIVLATFFGTESFGGPTVKGIDCAAEVIAHELYHKWVTDQWKAGGSFAGKADSDKGLQAADCDDRLPDFYETATSHTLNNDTDTYDLEHRKSSTYRTYGDQEYMAMRTADGARGTSSKDWANPGKQSNPPYCSSISTPYEGPVQAKFTGNYSDLGIDIDGDGLYNFLTVSAELDVTNGGIFRMVGFLNDTFGDNIMFINKPLILDTGIQTITLNLSGIAIWKHGVNGPFNVTMLLSDEYGNEIDLQYYTTNVYNYIDFQIPAAAFSRIYSDQGIDTDGDGSYNYLRLEVGIDVTKSQSYIIEGWLYDSNGNDVIMATNSTYLNVGSQLVTLNFDGLAINWHRVDGPYNLRYLSLSGSDQVDFIYDAYNTSAYSYTDFQKTNAGFSGSYSDHGKDTDGDGLYNYLTLGVGIDVTASGNYTLTGWLYDVNGTEIVGTSNFTHLNSGSQLVLLDFNGASIYKNGVDGPYDLRYLALYDENGTLMDTLNYAYTTSAYNYTDFQYLVLLTGDYSDYGTDTDGDGLYNYLTVDVGAKVAANGNCFIYARLMDINETEIVSASNVTFLYANQTQTIQLNFNGTYIHENMVDGPYYVRDVYIYHQGDPTQSDYVYDAYTTNAYNYADFDYPYDVAVVNVTPSKTVVGQGYSLNINVTAANQGDYTETFNVTAYANAVGVDNGLVGHWSFDEGSGTTAHDSSGNNNHGTIHGASWTDGKFGKAISFDGVDDYVEVPDSPSLKITDAITIAAWVKFEEVPVEAYELLMKYGSYITYAYVSKPEGVSFNFGRFNGGIFDHLGMYASLPYLPYSQWHYVVWVYNSSGYTAIYVNGNLYASTTEMSGKMDISSDNFEINGRWLHKGLVDEVRIYNRTLSRAEIKAIAGSGAIATQVVTLESGASTTITFTWTTVDFVKGNYTISAYAQPVPGETDTTDNTFVDGWIIVAMPGDITGPDGWPDGKVDMRDVYLVARGFGAEHVTDPDDPRHCEYWHKTPCGSCPHTPNADINCDGKIDMRDIYVVARNFGKTDP